MFHSFAFPVLVMFTLIGSMLSPKPLYKKITSDKDVTEYKSKEVNPHPITK